MSTDTAPDKSSFLKRQLSKTDAIKQIYRPHMGAKVSQAMDLFDRLVSDLETVTILGEAMTAGSRKFHFTPADLAADLDEFPELQQIATEGRAFLTKIGYVSRRKNTPFVGAAPVGQTVQIQPIETQLPGSEPLSGAVISPIPPVPKP